MSKELMLWLFLPALLLGAVATVAVTIERRQWTGNQGL